MKKKTRLFNLIILISLLLSACNLPSGNNEDLASTAAAQTVQALLMSATPLSGAVYTPSFTPLPALPATLTPIPTPILTNTPLVTPTSNCNVAQFITDVTIPDGTVMPPGNVFTKKWRFKNIGSCTWTGFSLVFDSGDAMNGPASKAISTVNPGQEIDLEVQLTAPATVGNYRGYWRITTSASVSVPIVNGYQGKSFYVDIKVQNPVTATFTLPPAIVFAVTGVTYSVSTWSSGGNVNCPRIIANISTNGAGTVTYTWTSTSGTNSPETLVFSSAGTQSINYDWARGSVWAGTPDSVGIYIDAPNHQDFGSQTFTTACTTP
jgi:hypothetical protein